MNHETLEQAAMKYSDKSNRGRPSIAWVIQDVKDAFIAGASWREQQAASGFFDFCVDSGWVIDQDCDVWFNKSNHAPRFIFERVWQASALHSAKLLAEKEAEIEQIKDQASWYLSLSPADKKSFGDLIVELSQAKELIDRQTNARNNEETTRMFYLEDIK